MQNEITQRPWGHYKILHAVDSTVKVKELVVNPGHRLSMQRHQHRAEHWFVVQGIAMVYTLNRKTDAEFMGEFSQHQHIHIDKGEWHQLCNESEQSLHVIEIQYGDNCIEEDIERFV